MTDRLQPGIYWREGEEQGACFGLLLLDVDDGCDRERARAALGALWAMLSALRDHGRVRDLARVRPDDPEITVPTQGLTVLLGLGARLFADVLDPALRPRELAPLGRGPRRPFPSLQWAPEAEQSPGEADLAVQLIADRQITIDRAVVETAKLIADERLPLRVAAYHRGFRRDDGRSWTDFGDGTNNLTPPERRVAIEVTEHDPPWMQGGTYLAFLRIAIDLAAWRRLSWEQQELAVGRQKLTGCPLASVERREDGTLVGVPDTDPHRFLNPPRAVDRLIGASHIHRSNVTRAGPRTAAANRIYRQGYEFLDVRAGGELVLGLNFVSFQRAPKQLGEILRLAGWQGDSNFGGPEPPGPGEPSIALMRVLAGGWYAVPPVAAPFPGADLF